MFPIKDNVPTRSFPVVTVSLIAANVLVYLWEVSKPGLNQHVESWGYYPCAVEGPCTTAAAQDHHELVETVFSSMFMHGGLMHIGGNMLFLWIFGNNIEDKLGPFIYLLFYLAGGIVATATQMATDTTSTVPLIGASGAIAAVMGAYIVWFPRARILTWIAFLLIVVVEVPAWIVLGFWFGSQFFTQEGSGVAWMAHVGGFVFGAGLAAMVHNSRWWLRRSVPKGTQISGW
ncbi:MAG: rhomboid family intramembrane serine protease [Gaiellaceae bacterium]